ncbi:MAG TPA: transglutaminase domain-containing protein, partial [Phycisphaerae bacterium]|nr:transglutaminase domain-containing protein [Phycisphaerae bacterium]
MKMGLPCCVFLLLSAVSLYGQPLDIEKQYYAVFVGPAKIGYIRTTRTVEGGRVITASLLKISAQRDKFRITAKVSIREVETADGKPLSFRTVKEYSGTRSEICGEIQPDGKLKMTVKSGGDSKKMKIVTWPAGSVMSEGARLIAMKKGLAPGTKYDVLEFDADSCTARKASITVGELQNVRLTDRTTKLHKITQMMIFGSSVIGTTLYVDDECNAMKTVTGMMGMDMTMVACDRSFALSPCNREVDFLKKLSIPSPVDIPDNAVKAIYLIQPLQNMTLKFPQIANQTVKKKGKLYEVTVTAVEMSASAEIPYKGQNRAAIKALKPSEYVQSDSPEIRKLADQAVGDAKNAATAAVRIRNFVRGYITHKDLSVGFASAMEVARSRTGDCTEHAVLTAALCRAAGIPARVVFGIVYVHGWLNYKDVFMG